MMRTVTSKISEWTGTALAGTGHYIQYGRSIRGGTSLCGRFVGHRRRSKRRGCARSKCYGEKPWNRNNLFNTTGDDGSYRLIALPPGEYEVTAEAATFKKVAISPVKLTVGQSAELRIKMEVGG